MTTASVPFVPQLPAGAPSPGFSPLVVSADADGFVPRGQASTWLTVVPSPPEAIATPALAPRDVAAEAEAVLERARLEAADITARAYTEGAQAGREAAMARFSGAADDLLTTLRQEWAARLDQIEADAVAAVVDLVRQLMLDRCAADEAAVLPLVRESIRRLADSAIVRVSINPAHQAAVRAAQGELAAMLAGDARLEIYADSGIEPAGCLAQGDAGSIDARLSSRLQVLRQAAERVAA